MEKGKGKKIVALLIAFAMLFTGLAVSFDQAEADSVDEAVSYATVKSIADFRNWIDNDNPYSSQSVITTDWSGNTGVYTVKIPSDGKMLVASLNENGHVNCELYTNYSLTSKLGEVKGKASARDEIGSFDVKAGTYYFRGSRWNGTGDATITIYIGLIPISSKGVTYSDTSVKYNPTNNATYPAISTKQEFVNYVNNNGGPAVQDTISKDWSGYSDTHSFTVEENGWLFVYPLAEESYVWWRLFSNKNLSSMILSEKTLAGTTKEPYACYLTAGTYYFRGSRWNGTNPFTFTTYLGFMKDSSRFAVASNTNSTANSATVTFTGSNGLIRVVKGEFDASNIKDDTFWSTSDRANALEGKTATITANGNYVARLETEDGYYIMTSFTVSGLSSTTKVYKVTAKKTKITVKVKKKATIKYSVTKGYKGKVKFTTSNKKIATVSSKGVVQGKKKGKCKITLKLTNGKKAVVTVTVKK